MRMQAESVPLRLSAAGITGLVCVITSRDGLERAQRARAAKLLGL